MFKKEEDNKDRKQKKFAFSQPSLWIDNTNDARNILHSSTYSNKNTDSPGTRITNIIQSKRDLYSKYNIKVNRISEIYTIKKRNYDINVEAIKNGMEKRTTCMLKNIPSRYNYNEILRILDKNHKAKYNFVYLLMNFKENKNSGYAFVDFINSKELSSFYLEINNKLWEETNCKKLAEMKFAYTQGINEFLQKIKQSNVLTLDKIYWPRVYYTDGEKMGSQQNILERLEDCK